MFFEDREAKRGPRKQTNANERRSGSSRQRPYEDTVSDFCLPPLEPLIAKRLLGNKYMIEHPYLFDWMSGF